MNNSVKTVILFLILCMIFTSCRKNAGKEFSCKDEDTIDKILIQFHPSFHDNSLMLLDFLTKELTFHRMTPKEYYKLIAPKEIVRVQAPISMNFQIDPLSYSFLRDTISFNKEDFIDKKRNYYDGIFHTILYMFNSGRIEDVDIDNSLTENERKLIVKLIDLSILQSTDSLTKKYLEDLKEYHN